MLNTPNRKYSLEEMISMGFDTYVMGANVIVPLLTAASQSPKRSSDVKAKKAVGTLCSWNRWATEDSYAFTYLFYWAKAYQKLYSDEAFGRFVGNSRKQIDIHSSEEQEQAWRALYAAIKVIEHTWGSLQVRWGDVNKVSRRGVFPVGGADLFDTLHPDTGPEPVDGKIYCDGSWGHLMIVMESTPKQVWSLLPFGESEHPDSPHYNDQTKLHSRREVKPFWFSAADILANTESVWGDPKRMQRNGMLPASQPGSFGLHRLSIRAKR